MRQAVQDEQIKAKAKLYRESLGGKIFCFPAEKENPYSEYAVVVYADGEYFVYPQATDISVAAVGVLAILDEMKKVGMATDYETDVRFISHPAQVDAPSVTMRRLKKDNVSKSLLQDGEDIKGESEDEGYILSVRGTIKITYLTMVDEDNPKAAQFMDEYYKLLAMNRYGKTAAAIKREVSRMGKEEAIRWIEQTYQKYIKDDMEVMGIFNRLKS